MATTFTVLYIGPDPLKITEKIGHTAHDNFDYIFMHCSNEQDAIETIPEFKEDNQDLAVCIYDIPPSQTTLLLQELINTEHPKCLNIILFEAKPWQTNKQIINSKQLFVSLPRQDSKIANQLTQKAIHFYTEQQQLLKHNLKLSKKIKKLEDTLSERTTELLKKNIALQTLSVTDKLTQLPNRLKLDQQFQRNINLCRRYNNQLSIILIDIDHFKQVNDDFGHQIGDQVLIEFADILKLNIRETDTVGRWGGEEFLVLCPSTENSDALNFAEKLRGLIFKHKFKTIDNKTASFGVTTYLTNDNEDSMISRADKALYKAKENGRNRIQAG